MLKAAFVLLSLFIITHEPTALLDTVAVEHSSVALDYLNVGFSTECSSRELYYMGVLSMLGSIAQHAPTRSVDVLCNWS